MSRILVIVAHPDDEIIWMGGTILNNPQVEWTIFSVCRASDTDREPKFRRVSEHLGAKAIIADLDDEDELSLQDATTEAEKIILEKLQGETFDILFTHGLNGEYGHERHIAVHNAINNLSRDKKIKPENIYFPDPKNASELFKVINELNGVDICFGGIGINGHIAFNEPMDPNLISVEEFKKEGLDWGMVMGVGGVEWEWFGN